MIHILSASNKNIDITYFFRNEPKFVNYRNPNQTPSKFEGFEVCDDVETIEPMIALAPPRLHHQALTQFPLQNNKLRNNFGNKYLFCTVQCLK